MGSTYQDPGGFSVWFPSPPSGGKCSLDEAGSYLALTSQPAGATSLEQAARDPGSVLGERRWSVLERRTTPQGIPCLDFALKGDTERRWVRVAFPGRGLVFLDVCENPAREREQLWTNVLTPLRQVDFWGHFYRRERDRFWSSLTRP